MICSKRYFFLFFFVLLGSFFISLSLNVNDSFALTHSYTFTSNTSVSANTPVFPDCTSSDCLSQFRYITTFTDPDFSFGNNDRDCFYKTTTVNSTSTLRNSFICSGFSSSIQIAVRDSSGIASFVFDGSYTIPSGVTFVLSDSFPSFSSAPSGSLNITENGTYDVSSYAEAVVDVPASVIQGDYHDDLTSINQSILICGAVLLVLYFFYCIYRMIIKSTGGK